MNPYDEKFFHDLLEKLKKDKDYKQNIFNKNLQIDKTLEEELKPENPKWDRWASVMQWAAKENKLKVYHVEEINNNIKTNIYRGNILNNDPNQGNGSENNNDNGNSASQAEDREKRRRKREQKDFMRDGPEIWSSYLCGPGSLSIDLNKFQATLDSSFYIFSEKYDTGNPGSMQLNWLNIDKDGAIKLESKESGAKPIQNQRIELVENSQENFTEKLQNLNLDEEPVDFEAMPDRIFKRLLSKTSFPPQMQQEEYQPSKIILGEEFDIYLEVKIKKGKPLTNQVA